jgi:hypothetical protein
MHHSRTPDRINERAMKPNYDPEQVIQPLEVARQAALVGGASGTHMVLSSFFSLLHFCFDSRLHMVELMLSTYYAFV